MRPMRALEDEMPEIGLFVDEGGPWERYRPHRIREIRNDLPGPGGHIGGWCEDCGDMRARVGAQCPGRTAPRVEIVRAMTNEREES